MPERTGLVASGLFVLMRIYLNNNAPPTFAESAGDKINSPFRCPRLAVAPESAA
jgi:hypothetical protein